MLQQKSLRRKWLIDYLGIDTTTFWMLINYACKINLYNKNMFEEDRISPWSIYDKKLRNSKSLKRIYDKKVYKKVDEKQ